MRALQRGFSLIELMIVVSIIGILSSMAIPAYQDFIIRSQVSEGLVVMTGIKNAVTETWAQTGNMPADRAAASLPAAANSTQSKYVSGVDVGAGGIITITYGNSANTEIDAQTIQLTPYIQPDRTVIWRCGNADMPSGAVSGAYAAGTIPARYMPMICRTGN